MTKRSFWVSYLSLIPPNLAAAAYLIRSATPLWIVVVCSAFWSVYLYIGIYALTQRLWSRVSSAAGAPIDIELGPPWKDGFSVPSSSRQCLSVQKRYLRAGAEFGDAVSYLYMGECIGFEKLLDAWAKAEKRYASVGFRTLPVEVFVKLGGYGKKPDGVGVMRHANEKPVYHAELYRKYYLGKGPVLGEAKELPGGGFVGEWCPPRTGDIKD